MTTPRPLPTLKTASKARWRHLPPRGGHLIELSVRTLLGLASLAALGWLGYRTARYLPIVGSPGLFVVFYGLNVFAAYTLSRSRLTLAAISSAILLYQVRTHMSFRIDFDSVTTDGLFGLPTAALSLMHLMVFVVAYPKGIAGHRKKLVSREA
ncbi:MAG TPA: hypothetical protein VM282_13375 [Acidimicrobiales bacterium]|nr:hypothetical protein [Acidimicrobiales bacterium]